MGGEVFLRNLEPSLARRPSSPVVDDTNVSLTGVELLQRIADLRGRVERWIRPGDVAVVLLPSSVTYLALQAALVDTGAVFIGVPADATYLVDEVSTRCTPAWYVIAAGDESTWEIAHSDESADAGLLIVDLRTATVEMVRDNRRASHAEFPAAGRVVVATSGSTGKSKLVSLTPEAYWYAAVSISEVTGVSAEDLVLHHLPIQRGAGWLLWGSVAAGARNLILPTRTPDLPELLRSERVSATFSVSVGLDELVRQDFSSDSLPDLRMLYYSSGPVTVGLKHKLTERFGGRLVQDYGMTEVPEPLTVLSGDDHLRGLQSPEVLSSVGRPLNPGRISLAPHATAASPAMIRVRSPHMFEGYWGDSPSPASRWHDTDDLGYFDKNGYLHLVGRRSESVRSGGVSFSLDEIRRSLRSVLGVVNADVQVVSDERLGERARASVLVADGSDLDAAEVRHRLRSIVTDPRMIPSEIVIANATATFD